MLDLGANHGAFSKYFSQNFGSKCYLVEANPILVSELKENSAFHVLHAAATGKAGPVTFNIAEVDDASTLNAVSTSAIKSSFTVDGLRYSDILQRFNLQTVDVLKVDIEGAEIDFIAAMTDQELLAIKQITVEFHDQNNYYPYAQTEKTVSRLIALGFTNMSMMHNTLDILLVNNKLCEYLWLEKLRLKYLTKPLLKAFWAVQSFLTNNQVLYK